MTRKRHDGHGYEDSKQVKQQCSLEGLVSSSSSILLARSRLLFFKGQFNEALRLLEKVLADCDEDTAVQSSTANHVEKCWKDCFLARVLHCRVLTRVGRPRDGLASIDAIWQEMLDRDEDRASDNGLHHADSQLVLNQIELHLAQVESLAALERDAEAREVLHLVDELLSHVASLVTPILNARIRYHHAAILQRLGKLDESLARLQEALDIINQACSENADADIESLALKASILTMMGRTCYLEGHHDDALQHYTCGLTLWETLDNAGEVSRVMNDIGIIHHVKGDFDKALEYYERGLVKAEKSEVPESLGRLLNSIGVLHQDKGNFGQALKFLEQALTLRKKIGNLDDIASSLNNIGNIYHRKGELDRALEYYEQSLALWEQAGDSQSTILSKHNIALIYHAQGELEKALQLYQQCLAAWEHDASPRDLALLFNSIGVTYRELGDVEGALEHLHKSLTLWQQVGNPLPISGVLYSLIVTELDRTPPIELLDVASTSTDVGTPPSQQAATIYQYMRQLEQCVHQQSDNMVIRQRRDVAQALISLIRTDALKGRQQLRELMYAETLLETVIKEPIVDFFVTMSALLALTLSLVKEARLTKNPETWQHLGTVLNKILEAGRQQRSHVWIAHAYWLQARAILVMKGQFSEARQLLTQAQLIAEEHGLHRIAAAISDDHDTLLTHSRVVNTPSGRQEILDFSDEELMHEFESLIQQMVHQRMALEERDARERPYRDTPVAFFILSAHSGLPLYMRVFNDELHGTPAMISGLIAAVQKITENVFSRKIDRMVVGEYHVVYLSDDPLLLVYACRGPSYDALNRLRRFKDALSGMPEQQDTVIRAANSNWISPSAIKTAIQDVIVEIFENPTTS